MKFKICILAIFILISCKEEKKDSTKLSLNTINIGEWNSITLKSFNQFCDIKKNEYSYDIPLNISANGDTLTIESHFCEHLRYRKKLIKELNSDFFEKKIKELNQITIIETYNNINVKGNQIIFYEVFFDQDKLLFHLNYDPSEERFDIKSKPWENPNNHNLINDSRCINELEIDRPLNHLSIKNKLVFLENDNINYLIQYIYLD